MADAAAPPIVVGRVRKPHGLKGELAIFPLTDDPPGIFVTGRTMLVLDLAGEEVERVTLTQARVYHRECLLRFAGFEDRDHVEHFRGLFLAMPREEMAPLDEGEVYQQELLGWSVRNEADEPLGIVSAVYDLPQGCTIEIQGPRREFLLPFRGEYIRRTDRDARQLIVEVPRGLLD
ncbi:MAG TPA: ribosome maturation factor RimM [Gemmatimonadales bacterium]|jgi:16S rRNA processing protein RimM|nr:ribosome maturation factor RimM [Gemmatimonadales bacterium]